MRLTVVVLLMVFQSTFSWAQSTEPSSQDESTNTSDKELAKNYYKLGAELYQRADYENAMVQFKKAYEYVKRPALLFNIGRCHESLGQHEKAIELYQSYLETNPPDAVQIKVRIQNLTKIVEKRREDEEKLKKEQEEKAEQKQIEKAQAQTPATQTQTAPVTTAVEKETPMPPAKKTNKLKIWGWVTVGTSVALVAVGGVFAALATNKASEVVEASSYNADLDNQGKTYNTIATATLIGGGIVAVAGGVLLYLHYTKPDKEKTNAWIMPAIVQNGVVLSGGLRF